MNLAYSKGLFSAKSSSTDQNCLSFACVALSSKRLSGTFCPSSLKASIGTISMHKLGSRAFETGLFPFSDTVSRN